MSFESSAILPIIILAAIGLWFAYAYLSAYVAKQPQGMIKLWGRNAAPFAMCALGLGIAVTACFANKYAHNAAPDHAWRHVQHDYLLNKINSLDIQVQQHIDGTIDLNGQETIHAELYESLNHLRETHTKAVNDIAPADEYFSAGEVYLAFVFLLMIGVATLVYGIYMIFEVRRLAKQ